MAHNWQRRDVTLAGWILVLFIAALSLAFGRHFAVLGSLVREHAVPLSFVVLLFAVAVATGAFRGLGSILWRSGRGRGKESEP